MSKRPAPPSPSAAKPAPSRRSFVVRIDGALPDSGAGMTAHITPVGDLHAVLEEHDVHLGSEVSGIIADLLAQMVREEEEGTDH